MTATSAEVRFGAGGVAKVASHLHLTASTYIDCFAYEDTAPIVVINDAPVDVTITVPDPGQVTEDDVACARRLAEAVARYAAGLGQLAAARREPGPGAADAAGRAA